MQRRPAGVRWRAPMVCAAVALAAACADGAPQHGPGGPGIVSQASQVQCAIAGTDARSLLLRNRDDWARVVGGDEAGQLGRPVDWDSGAQVVLHAMAQQPTTGYSVRALGVQPGDGGRWQLRLQFDRPGPGAMVGMALTRPCVFVLLPQGQPVAIDLVDEQGRVVDVARMPAADAAPPAATPDFSQEFGVPASPGAASGPVR